MARENLTIGVLGYGSIGERHADNAFALGQVVSVYDPVGMTGKTLKPFLVMNRDSVIHNCDAIVVASPSKEHAHDLMDAIHAGRHVLCEKPFGYDCPPLLDGFIQGARSKHPELIIATGFNLRFHSCVKKAKELVGSIGNIQAASFTVNQKTTKPPYLMDGIIRNWMSHEIDLAHWLLGEGNVVHCSAELDGQGRDTISAIIVMKFPSVSDKVFIQADYFSDPEQRYFWIEGDKASLYVNLVTREVFLREAGGDPKPVMIGADTWDENYLEEMQAFIASIEAGKHLAPLATAEDGVRALYTVMAAREKAGLNDT